MIPSALAAQLQQGLADFLRVSFWSSTPGMERVVDDLIAEPGGLGKGPYLSVKLPFVTGSKPDYFPEVPLPFTPHAHQERAFGRLGGGRSTLVATGTGSGKTECFVQPILDHCLAEHDVPGVKAILIYPMNALGTDQAERLARAIHGNERLRGRVTAGLYIGGQGRGGRGRARMGKGHILTDRVAMRKSPPHILLTNYKMLDYLLLRPRDRTLWQHNTRGVLRYLVVDELHTFDGAQGTDLACLIRRLKRRLQADDGELCCVGTSATLGGPSAADELRGYASEVFGERFDTDSVVGESRVSAEEFLAGVEVVHTEGPDPGDVDALDPARAEDEAAWLRAQTRLWFGDELAAGDGWRVELGRRLKGHATFRSLLKRLDGGVVSLDRAVASLGRSRRDFREDERFGRLAVLSLLGLVSAARAWRAELPEVRTAREDRGEARPTQALVDVRLQVWQRELRRMVASVQARPRLQFSDDLDRGQRQRHLPLIHCRDCGAMGWATRQDRDKPHLLRVPLTPFYRAFFGRDPQVRFLFPRAAVPDDPTWKHQPTLRVDTARLVVLDDDEEPEGEAVELVPSHNTRSTETRKLLHRDCPFCGARESLTLVGFRAATLTATFIDQLFASRFNDDRKLLAFSDSVQDAAHRAGFFGARTWRSNLRIALQHVVEDGGEGLALSRVPELLARSWQERLDPATWIATFLAPSMDWLHDWDALKERGELPADSDLVTLVERRLVWEVMAEYGQRSAIGRALPRAGGSAAYLPAGALDGAVDAVLEPLRNEVPGLREVSRGDVRRFVLGLVHRLRARGAIVHDELPRRFVETCGSDRYVFRQLPHLSQFGPAARLPAFVVDKPGTARFDHWTTRSKRQPGWYARWVTRALGGDAALGADASSVYPLVLPLLSRTGLLRELEGAKGERIWGLADDVLCVTADLARVTCSRCGLRHNVGTAEAPAWEGAPCQTARCDGRLVVEGPAARDYFGRLSATGELNRIFTAEHTGLLERPERERVEREFKADPDDAALPRKPWFANLLSCTPTLEMGIDIGDLSSAILCSVPPGQANYLQRIGRVGRRDGNSLLLTVANARPHDLFFYADPMEMMEGEVQPPGVFLDAAAVLERQLVAYCLDRWVALEGDDAVIPDRLREAFDGLASNLDTRFPHNLLAFVHAHQPTLLREFEEMFGDRISEAAQEHLSRFLLGTDEGDASLRWRIHSALAAEAKQRDSLSSRAAKLAKEIRELEDAKAKPKDHDEQIRKREAEKEALLSLVTDIDRRQTLEFLTDEGMLPNYAFPESAVRLTSVIWRRKRKAEAAKGAKYDTWSYKYTRSPGSALSELAPGASFYAGARRVAVDQVDVAVSEVETWRFCSDCNHASPVGVGEASTACPACGSESWPDPAQLQQLLRLRQVFAGARDQDSRIRDDTDERQPRFFQRQMLVEIRDDDREGAWSLDEPTLPFGFEYLHGATFREVNFGELANQGEKTRIAGREQIRPGFRICALCGKVQPRKADKDPVHAFTCPALKKSTKQKFQDCLYLYREFDSEALRLLLPLAELGSSRQLNSFVAALQLGLKDRFGGRVDHLLTTVYSDPVPGSSMRKQFLVLFDSVPGGTGYIKQLITPDADGGELPLLDVIRRAKGRLESCSCWTDPERDGCYRCLLGYRNSRDMDDTSAAAAVEILGRILDAWSTLEPVESLGDVSISGLLDSVLEARFLEALRQAKREGRQARFRPDMVNNKPGYLFQLGGKAWTVEPQVELAGNDGVAVPVSIDFVLRPAWAHSDRRPIAVFLDGWQYHRERIGKDMLQRMALQATGRWDVWSLTWFDLDRVLLRSVKHTTTNLVHPRLDKLRSALMGKLPAYKEVAERPVFDVLVDELVGEAEGPWRAIGERILASRMRPVTDEDLAAWKALVKERLPAAARPMLAAVEPKLMALDPGQLSPWFTLAAVHDGADLVVVAALDDSDEAREEPGFRETWNGYLQLFQMLRGLPDLWFVTRHRQDEWAFHDLLVARSGPPEEHSWADDPDDVLPEYRELCRALADAEVEAPEFGYGIPDEHDGEWASAELTWEDRRVAVTDRPSLDEARGSAPAGWRIFVFEELDDPGELIDALRGGGA